MTMRDSQSVSQCVSVPVMGIYQRKKESKGRYYVSDRETRRQTEEGKNRLLNTNTCYQSQQSWQIDNLDEIYYREILDRETIKWKLRPIDTDGQSNEETEE